MEKTSSGVLLVSPSTIRLTTSLTHTRTRDNVPTYYAIDNATIERRITMSAERGFLTPGRKDVWVNHVTMGIHHDCITLDVVFIVACNRRKSARRKKICAYS